MARVKSSPATEALERAQTLPDIFNVVKDIVRRHLGVDRSGLMLGLSNLGGGMDGLIGGFFQVGGNMIVMNKFPLWRLETANPELYKPYVFHILLHEYIHSIGYLTEQETRPLVLELSRKEFGEEHPVTQFALGWRQFMPNLVFPDFGWQPNEPFSVEVVRGFDPDASSYIH